MDTTVHSQEHRYLEWMPEYSVGIEEIDMQHKRLIEFMNQLIRSISDIPQEEEVKRIIDDILQYKSEHFATEEKYFHEFNYDAAEEHAAKHREFSKQIEALQKHYAGDVIGFAFAIVDFLGDWLIGHLMWMDKKYTQCFHDHGKR